MKDINLYYIKNVDDTIKILEDYIKDRNPTKAELIAKGEFVIKDAKEYFDRRIKSPTDYSNFCDELDRRFEELLLSSY